MLETLLKNISSLLKKNKAFFEENPEIFLAVKERFEKAIEDDDPWDYSLRDDGYGDEYSDKEDEQSYQDEDQAWDAESKRDPKYQNIDDDEQESGPEFLSEDYIPEQSYDPFSDEDTEQDRALAELEQQKAAKPKQVQPTPDKKAPSKQDEDLYSDEAFAAKPSETKASSRSQWKQKENYAPHHAKAIAEFTGQGYSPREAEALAGAHEKMTMQDTIKRNISPSDPSPKMLQMLQRHIGDIFSSKKMAASINLNPEENPDLHLHANKNSILKQAHLPFKEAAAAYRKSLAEQGKADHEIDNMMPAFKKQWTTDNQAHIQNKHAAVDKVAGIAKDNKEARERRLMETKGAVIMSTKQGGESSPIVGDVSNVAGGQSNKEAIRQAAGGIKGGDDEPTQTATSVDPHYRMAARNPAFVKQLELQVVKKLKPDQVGRLQNINAIKKKGDT